MIKAEISGVTILRGYTHEEKERIIEDTTLPNPAYENLKRLSLIWYLNQGGENSLKFLKDLAKLETICLFLRLETKERILEFFQSFSLPKKVRTVIVRAELITQFDSNIAEIENFPQAFQDLELLETLSIDFRSEYILYLLEDIILRICNRLSSPKSLSFGIGRLAPGPSLANTNEINFLSFYKQLSLSSSKNLETLKLSFTNISLSGIKPENLNFPNLKYLNLDGTILAPQNLDYILEALHTSVKNVDLNKKIKEGLTIKLLPVQGSDGLQWFLNFLEKIENFYSISICVRGSYRDEFITEFLEIIPKLKKASKLKLNVLLMGSHIENMRKLGKELLKNQSPFKMYITAQDSFYYNPEHGARINGRPVEN